MSRTTLLTHIRLLNRIRARMRLDKREQVAGFVDLYKSRYPKGWTDEQVTAENQWVDAMIEREYPPINFA